MKTKLVLLTSGFPYGTSEPFLENEIDYLAGSFDEVVIFAINPQSESQRKLPDNCKAISVTVDLSPLQKLAALRFLFSPEVQEEKEIVQGLYKKQFKDGILKTALISWHRARMIKKELLQKVELNDQKVKTYFYSYWCDDAALAIAMLRKENDSLIGFCRIHGWDVYFEASIYTYLPFRHFIARNLNKIYSISERGKQYAKEVWKLPDLLNVEVSRLGVKEQEILPNREGRFLIVSCSNVIPLKRIDLIVRSLSLIKDHELEWVHFGDGPLYEEIKELSSEILPPNISWRLMGRVSNSDLLDWYRQNLPSVFINVSTTEGVPVSIMEAMSFGIPVIATDVGGTSEIVNTENGMLLPSESTDVGIGEVISNFIDNQDVLKSKKNASKINWKLNFNADKNFSSFIENVLKL